MRRYRTVVVILHLLYTRVCKHIDVSIKSTNRLRRVTSSVPLQVADILHCIPGRGEYLLKPVVLEVKLGGKPEAVLDLQLPQDCHNITESTPLIHHLSWETENPVRAVLESLLPSKTYYLLFVLKDDLPSHLPWL